MRQPNTNPNRCNRVFVSKSYEASLYKWSPACNQIKKRMNESIRPTSPYYCDARPYSQGQDWITRYVYDIIVVNHVQQRSAYVECDYVE